MVELSNFLKSLTAALTAETCYLAGGFGQRLTNPMTDWYNVNYSWNKTNKIIIDAHSNTDPITYGFDCICLIKAALWNFSANPKKTYGGTKYESNSVPDCSIETFYKNCYDLSEDFSVDPEPGEILFYDSSFSHVGVSIGNGYVVESTPAWKCGVQKTLLPNRLNPEAVPVRKWWKHGKSNYINYKVQKPEPEPVKDWKSLYNLLIKEYTTLQNTNKQLTSQNGNLLIENTLLKERLKKIKEVATYES